MEGPSLVLLREEVQMFKSKKILNIYGLAKIDYSILKDKRIRDFKTWGKYFLIQTTNRTIRIHFGMFGSYRINGVKNGRNPSLSIEFSNGVINFYTASIRLLEEDPDKIFDWSIDVLSPSWSVRKAKKRLLMQAPDEQIGDLLLQQDLFAGVGNIIRNEVLYRSKVHPESRLGNIPDKKLLQIVRETHQYSEDFLKWKRKFELRKHWELYAKRICPAGHSIKKKYPGKTKRRAFICKCLVNYN